jgi:hypothetical protein
MSDKRIVVYSTNIRISYVGELVSDSPEEISLTRALLLEKQADPQTGEVQGTTISPVFYASRDSKVTISKKIAPGILIDNIDSNLLNAYEREVIQCYSSLKLA